MSQVYNNSDKAKQSPVSAQSQLEKLKADLITKREASVEQGLVEDIQMIDKALTQVDSALEKVSLDQKISNSQARLGQIRPATESVTEETAESPKVISAKEAEQIKAIRGVAGREILPGEQFASMSGREPSNVSYMRDNINGLFDLVALKG